jgi:hypothetical protein
VQIRHWALVAGAAVDIPVANDLVTSLVPNASGVVFATAEPTLGLVDAANRAHVAQSPRHIDFHDRERTLVRLSRSGAEIEVTQAHGRPLVVDVSMREFSRADVAARDFVPPTTSAYGMTITDWRDNRAPRVNGESGWRWSRRKPLGRQPYRRRVRPWARTSSCGSPARMGPAGKFRRARPSGLSRPAPTDGWSSLVSAMARSIGTMPPTDEN